MTPEQTPITGREEIASSEQKGALAAFYRAFNGRDLALMEANWAVGGEAIMDNPLGGIRRGWSNIRPTYEKLFGSNAKVVVEFFDYTITDLGDAFIAIGRERGTLDKGDLHLDLAIRTSRLFARRDRLWRQIHHHGSIDDSVLLARYQSAFA